MPRSAGTYSLPANAHGVPGNIISSTYYNNTIDDLGAEITNSLPRDGTAGMSGALKAADGAAVAPAITFASDTDTGFYRYSANELGVASSGADIGRFTAAGWNGGAYTNLVSAATTDLSTIATTAVNITGTTTITAFGSAGAGLIKELKFAGALTLTHNGTSLILPGGSNITTAAGDVCRVISEGSGNWRCLSYTPAASPAVAGMFLITSGTASSVSNVDLPLTTTYRSFKLSVTRFRPGTADSLLGCRFSTDGGLSYISTALYVQTGAYGTALNTGGGFGASPLTYAPIGFSTNSTGVIGQSTVDIHPGGTGSFSTIFAMSIGQSSSGNVQGGVQASFLNSAGASNYIRLLPSAGVITSMDYALYGLT